MGEVGGASWGKWELDSIIHGHHQGLSSLILRCPFATMTCHDTVCGRDIESSVDHRNPFIPTRT